jgi:hypothetical protein
VDLFSQKMHQVVHPVVGVDLFGEGADVSRRADIVVEGGEDRRERGDEMEHVPVVAVEELEMSR